MKLSEMATETGFDTMEKLLPDVADILSDDAVKEIKNGVEKENGKIVVSAVFAPVMRLFLGKHREAMYGLVATLCGKTPEDVKKQPLSETVATLRDGVSDEMLTFFASCLRMVMSA